MKLSCNNNYLGVEKLFLEEEKQKCLPPFELNTVKIFCVQNLECKAVSCGLARVKGLE